MCIDQLRHVLVTSGNHHLTAGGGTLPGQGADHVVGLDPVDAQQRQPQRPDTGMQRLDLAAQLVGHRRTVRFVVLEQLIAKGRALGIEHYREGALRVLLAQAFEHVQHALDRAGRLTGRSGQWWQSMEGAVQIGRTIDQDQGGIVSHASGQHFRDEKGLE